MGIYSLKIAIIWELISKLLLFLLRFLLQLLATQCFALLPLQSRFARQLPRIAGQPLQEETSKRSSRRVLLCVFLCFTPFFTLRFLICNEKRLSYYDSNLQFSASCNNRDIISLFPSKYASLLSGYNSAIFILTASYSKAASSFEFRKSLKFR